MRARCYSCAYWQIHLGDTDDTAEDENLPVPIKIERLHKKYKTHQLALDFNNAFISHTIRSTSAEREDPSDGDKVDDEYEDIYVINTVV
jgi:hypothetical protein